MDLNLYKINGSLINDYIFCKRRCSLLINDYNFRSCDNEDLKIGKLIETNS